MIEKKQTFCFSVLGTPLTKKRARTGVGISKSGNAYRWATTPDEDYEEMVRYAFDVAYPDALPIGYSKCKENPNPRNYLWEVKKEVPDYELPPIELDIIFYVGGGKIGDLSNYIKSIEDALISYAYVDDRQIKYYIPFVVCNKDFEGTGEEAEIERVDILIRSFSLWENKLFLLLRKIFKRKAIVVDVRDKFFHPYRGWNKTQLVECAAEVGLSTEGTKDMILQRLLNYDKKNGVNYFEKEE